MKRLIVGLLLALPFCVALADGPNNPGENFEASMLVTGTIDVTSAGDVKNYVLDKPDQLPAPVVQLIQQAIPSWKFDADSKSGAIREARMGMRIVLKPTDKEHDSLTIASTYFGNRPAAGTSGISYKVRQPPAYPRLSLNAHVSGTVYLLLEINAQGQVENLAAEQVNLGVSSDPISMQRYRDDLADAALRAAKNWIYNVPVASGPNSPQHWNVRVPVSFTLKRGSADDAYGKWAPYIPGPRQRISWIEKSPYPSASADAVAGGQISSATQSLHLLDAPGGT